MFFDNTYFCPVNSNQFYIWSVLHLCMCVCVFLGGCLCANVCVCEVQRLPSQRQSVTKLHGVLFKLFCLATIGMLLITLESYHPVCSQPSSVCVRALVCVSYKHTHTQKPSQHEKTQTERHGALCSYRPTSLHVNHLNSAGFVNRAFLVLRLPEVLGLLTVQTRNGN